MVRLLEEIHGRLVSAHYHRQVDAAVGRDIPYAEYALASVI
jgi:hypothetical protein